MSEPIKISTAARKTAENCCADSVLGEVIQSAINEACAPLVAALEKAQDSLTEFGQITDQTRVGYAIFKVDEALAQHRKEHGP